MRDVAIVGVGQTPVGKHESVPIGTLAASACRHAMLDAGVSQVGAVIVGNMMASQVTGQSQLGPLIASLVGSPHAESFTVSAACASGAAAVRQGYLAVASGVHDTVLAVGVEKMTCVDKSKITSLLASAADVEREVANGASFAALNALLMRRYMYEYSVNREDFAAFSLVAHQNATLNPNARLRAGLTHEDYLNSRKVADPVAVHDASPIADGAAAVVLRPRAEAADRDTVQILGSASATDSLSLQVRDDPLHFAAIEESARAAMTQANTTTDDVDFVEFHDAFTITTALSLEGCGFADRGKAAEFAKLGGIDRKTGRLPISTFGGLKARGHPVGATGTYQIVEAVLQLRGEAGGTKLPHPLSL